MPHRGAPVDPRRGVQLHGVVRVVGRRQRRDFPLGLIAALAGVAAAEARRFVAWLAAQLLEMLRLEVEAPRTFAVVATAIEHEGLIDHKGAVEGGGEELRGGGQTGALRHPDVIR